MSSPPCAFPSPAVTSARPHRHLSRRLFIGPLPKSALTSAKAEEDRAWYHSLAKHARHQAAKEGERWVGQGDLVRDGNGGRKDWLKGKIVQGHERRRARRVGGEDDGEGEAVEEGEALEISPSPTEEPTPSSWFSTLSTSKSTPSQLWVGTSFLIGGQLHDSPRAQQRKSMDTTMFQAMDESGRPLEDTAHRPTLSARTSTGVESFRTARTHLSLPGASNASLEPPPTLAPNDTALAMDDSLRSTPTLRRGRNSTDVTSGSEDGGSSTRNLIHQRRTVPSVAAISTLGDVTVPSNSPGKMQQKLRSALKTGKARERPHRTSPTRAKTVQFPITPSPAVSSQSSDLTSDHGPANPTDVLARSGEDVAGTSAGVIEARADGQGDGDDDNDFVPGEVIMRDRMLVRVSYSRDGGLVGYDEEIERRKPCCRVERFEEYLVVYRKGKVELYQEWNIPFKERYHHSKRLCYTIPLLASHTSMSIYSHDDLSFCLCLDAERSAADLEGGYWGAKQLERWKKSATGTEIFTFLTRERDRGVDWCWEIWKELGGELPATLDVQIPALSAVIRLPIPSGDYIGDERGRRSLTRVKVMEACEEALSAMPQYQDLITQVNQTGQEVELCLAWQTGGRLDWITESQDYDVDHRKRSWSVLSGYSVMPLRSISQLELLLSHHRPSTVRLSDRKLLEEPHGVEGFLTRIGDNAPNVELYVFSYSGNLFSSDVKRVHTPLPPSMENLPSGPAIDPVIAAFSAAESRRGGDNLLDCNGYIDFRDIADVANLESGKGKKSQCRFGITLRTGEKLVMQAHSEQSKAEWMRSLEEHREYWGAKQRVEARQKMEATGTLTRIPHPEADLKFQAGEGGIPQLWHWCCLEACTPIIHAGRLFVKKSSISQFRASYFILTRGHLVTFRIRRATAYHHKRKKYSLQQAYIYAGLLAQDEIISKTREDAWTGEPRVYQDGLECADGAEDCTFAIWIRGKDHERKTRKAGSKIEEKSYTPLPLGKKPKKLLVFRARSRIERDVWLWSIQIEMQRMAYDDPERVRNERDAGLVPKRT